MLLNEGDRVRFTGSVPIGNQELNLKGQTGKVTDILYHREDPANYIELILVKLDRRFKILDEWNNSVQFGRDLMLIDIVQLLDKI